MTMPDISARNVPPLTLHAGKWGGWSVQGDAFDPGPRAALDATTTSPVLSSHEKKAGQRGRVRSKVFTVLHPYLNFVIAGGDYEFVTAINVVADGHVVASETGRQTVALHSASLDLTRFIGQSLHIEVVDEADGPWGWICVGGFELSGTPVTAQQISPLYQEAVRPQVHFTARQWTMNRLNPGRREEGWLNDLNGLVHFDGEYHLFAQRWNKCWIHAVSRDLVYWTELEPAFFEEALDTGVQSGSCVVDYENSSGLGDGTTPPMVAFWSRNDDRSQCLSFSQDHGRSWTHWANNPFIELPERDPIVFRDHARSQWVMLIYGHDQYHFLTSHNLLDWKLTGATVGDSYECPDFFELRIDGERDTKWVLVRGDGRYSVGDFNGERFVEATSQLVNDAGTGFYATQSWGVGRGPAQRRVQVAWMQGGDYPQMPFSQQVSLPCELSLHRTPAGLRVYRAPVPELDVLEHSERTWNNLTIDAGQTWQPGAAQSVQRIRTTFDLGGGELNVDVHGIRIRVATDAVTCLGQSHAPITTVTALDIVTDRTSIEIFVNNGEVSFTSCASIRRPDLTLHAGTANVTLHDLSVADLKSIWVSP